jgi:ZU5 domain
MHRIRMLRLATLLILIALGAGCPAKDSDGSASDGGPEVSSDAHDAHDDAPVIMASRTVSSAGGEVKTQDGALAVQVPSGALDHNVKITVESTAAPASGSVGSVFEIGPTGTQFKQPVTISLKYAGEDTSDLRVATYADGMWQVLPNVAFDAEHHTISGDTMHLSPYALVRVMCPPDKGACFVPSGQMCSTRSFGCSGSGTAPDASAGTSTGGSGASSGGAGAPADSSALDAGVKADESLPPPPPPPPSSDLPPEKQDPYAAPTADAGTGGGTAADGGSATDAGVPVDAPADGGAAPIEEKPPVDSTCEKPTCASAPVCGGVPGAMRTACHDTETGIEETCCFAPTDSTAVPNGDVRDAGTDVGSSGGAGSGSSAGTGGTSAPDASVSGDPIPTKPEDADAGSSGGAGSGAGSGSGDVPPPPPPEK